MQQEQLERVPEIVVIELVVADAMKADRRTRCDQKIQSGTNGRPSANGAGRPPGATACLLKNVTRTNPQVAFGCRSSNRTISSAVKSPAIANPSGLVCAIESDGRTAELQPQRQPRAMACARLFSSTSLMPSGPYSARVLNRVQRATQRQCGRGRRLPPGEFVRCSSAASSVPVAPACS